MQVLSQFYPTDSVKIFIRATGEEVPSYIDGTKVFLYNTSYSNISISFDTRTAKQTCFLPNE